MVSPNSIYQKKISIVQVRSQGVQKSFSRTDSQSVNEMFRSGEGTARTGGDPQNLSEHTSKKDDGKGNHDLVASEVYMNFQS